MKNFTTFKMQDYKCLRAAQAAGIDASVINPADRRQMMNDLIYKIYSLLDSVDSPWWNRTATLTVSSDEELLLDFSNSSGIISAIDATALTITRTTGTFTAGSLIAVAAFVKSTGAEFCEFIARITGTGATATFSTIYGTPATISSAHIVSVCVFKAPSNLTTKVASLQNLYIKQIKAIWDSAGNTSPDRLFDLYTDVRKFRDVENDPYQASRISVLQEGDAVYIKIGSTADALSTVAMDYIAKPTIYGANNGDDCMDINPEHNQILTDELTAAFILRINPQAQLSADLQGSLAHIQKLYDAARASQEKALDQARNRIQ